MEASCGEWWKGEGGVTEPSTTYEGRSGEIWGDLGTLDSHRVNTPNESIQDSECSGTRLNTAGHVSSRALVWIPDFVFQLLGSTTVPAGASVLAPRARGPAGDTSCLEKRKA